jgi:hypothetical protein
MGKKQKSPICQWAMIFVFFISLSLIIFGAITAKTPAGKNSAVHAMIMSLPGNANATPTTQVVEAPRPKIFSMNESRAQAAKVVVTNVRRPAQYDPRVTLKGRIVIRDHKKSAEKRENKSLSIANYKWLMNHKWQGPVKHYIEKFGLPDTLYNVLISMPIQESGAKPDVKNDSSSALGLYQPISGTAKLLAEQYAAEYHDLDPRLLNRENPNENILLGVYNFKKNWEISKGSLKMTILLHLTGLGAAKDTIEAHGGIDNVPFVQRIIDIMNTEEVEPPQWAIAKWQNY